MGWVGLRVCCIFGLTLSGCCGREKSPETTSPFSENSQTGDGEKSSPTPTTTESSFDRAKRECDNGEGRACLSLGFRYRDGEGVSKNLREARQAFARACDLHSGKGCEQLAILETTSNGGERDLAEAEKHYRKGCELDSSSCWNAAEFVEMKAWAACESKLGRFDRDKVTVRSPVLEQDVFRETTYWSSPERWEGRVREPLFDRPYIEVKHFEKQTWTTEKDIYAQHAYLGIPVTNGTCTDVRISASASLHLGAGDALKRAAGGLMVGLLCESLNKGDPACRNIFEASLQPLTGSESAILGAEKSEIVTIRVDTQSLMGRNRKITGFELTSFQVSGPSDGLCRPECLSPLSNLSGELADIRRMYQRSCSEDASKLSCVYIKAITSGHIREDLEKACHGGTAPNVDPACKRLHFADWLPFRAGPQQVQTSIAAEGSRPTPRFDDSASPPPSRTKRARLGERCGECAEGQCLSGVCALERVTTNSKCQKTPGCRVRQHPSFDGVHGESRCYVRPGETLLVLAQEGRWKKIVRPDECGGGSGYIHRDVLEP